MNTNLFNGAYSKLLVYIALLCLSINLINSSKNSLGKVDFKRIKHPEMMKLFLEDVYSLSSSPKWMAGIKNKPISELSIPGSHDSMANVHKAHDPYTITQKLTLSEQYEQGIRFVDIRCRHFKNKFTIHHGPMYLNANFDDVLTDTRNFLKANPSEAVIMRVKSEHTPAENTRSFDDTFDEYSRNYSDIITFSRNMPYLDDIRGKVWVLFDFYYRDGFSWNSALIQDNYEVKSIATKKQQIKDHLFKALVGGKDQLYINFCSGWWYIYPPAIIAYNTNDVVTGFSGRLGLVVFDFPSDKVVEHVINQNQKSGR